MDVGQCELSPKSGRSASQLMPKYVYFLVVQLGAHGFDQGCAFVPQGLRFGHRGHVVQAADAVHWRGIHRVLVDPQQGGVFYAFLPFKCFL